MSRAPGGFVLNPQGGVDPLAHAALGRARRADLVTLPQGLAGTNCGNCVHARTNWAQSEFLCVHPAVSLPVTPRMCCALWDAPGTLRAWGRPGAAPPPARPRGGR